MYAKIYMCVSFIDTQTLGSLILSYECLAFWISSHILNVNQIGRSSMENNLARELKVQFQSLRTELVLLLSRDAFLGSLSG